MSRGGTVTICSFCKIGPVWVEKINKRDGDEVDKQRSCIFIDAEGILWNKDAGYDKEIILRQDAVQLLTSLAEPEEMEIVLLLEDKCPLDYFDALSLFRDAPWGDNIYTILKGNSPKKKAAEIVRCIKQTHDWKSFVILSTDHLEQYFPRRTVYIADGKLTEEHLQAAKNILERIEIQENFYILNKERLVRRKMWRNGPRKVIFLDIDGVLNTDSGGPKIEEQFVKRLAHIVQETGAEIILSSSWRLCYARCVDAEQDYMDDGVALLLETLEKYQLQITGMTPDMASGAYARPLEIRTWLQEQADTERFVILDDETFWVWNWLADYFVCTAHLNEKNKYEYGLTDKDAEKAIRILNRLQIGDMG